MSQPRPRQKIAKSKSQQRFRVASARSKRERLQLDAKSFSETKSLLEWKSDIWRTRIASGLGEMFCKEMLHSALLPISSPEYLKVEGGGAAHADCCCRTSAEINGAALNEGSAIIDSHYHRPAIAGMCNANPRSKGKGPVCCGHSTWVEFFPGCGWSSREFFTIV